MTPNHQKILDETLNAAYARMAEQINALNYPVAKEKQYNQDHLRGSQLAHDLTLIINFVEGYQVEENPSKVIDRVFRILHGRLASPGYMLPKGFHKTPLGELIYAAYELLIPRDKLMTTGEVRKAFGVQRQTIYDWVEENRLTAYYIRGQQMFYRPQIEQQAQKRAAMLRRKQVGIKELHVSDAPQ